MLMLPRLPEKDIVHRYEGKAKVLGSLEFPSDIYPDGVLTCCPVFAPHPHALIQQIDPIQALKVEGVVRVLTAGDIPGTNINGTHLDRPVFCDQKTRCEGDVLAVVVAESEAAARAGVQKVRVEYTPLPVVDDPEQALQPETIKIHPDGNILHQVHFKKGDPEGEFSRPDVTVFEHTFITPATDHAFLETEAGIAFPGDGQIRIITGGQDAFFHQGQVARALGMPPEQIQVIESYTGGSFGGKYDTNVQILIALAALKTGRPCRMVWSRAEHFKAGIKRHPAKITLKGALTRDGKLAALKARVLTDTGAYTSSGVVVLDVLVECLTGPYEIPHVELDAWSVFTNNFVSGAFRGFGANKACFAIEGFMSILARAICMDQVAFRQINLAKQGGESGIGHSLLAPIHTGQTLQLMGEHQLWKDRQQIRGETGKVRRGIGVALGLKGYGFGSNDAGDYGQAEITLAEDGRLKLLTGATELGQGSSTTLAQIAATTLRCSLSQIEVIAADTFNSVNSGVTAASRTTYVVGRGVLAAAKDLREKMSELAGKYFETAPESLVFEDGCVIDPDSGRSLPFAQISQLAGEPVTGIANQRAAYAEKSLPGAAVAHPHVLYASHGQIVQAAVDTETGEVFVERVAAFPDAGGVIYRDGMEGRSRVGSLTGWGTPCWKSLSSRTVACRTLTWSPTRCRPRRICLRLKFTHS
jgi:CO/xanthine dehydrogenase Mo-binding subunit